jgi:hypothetical protein
VSADPLRVALRVAKSLEHCGVRYTVGGSLASSVSGEPRSTLDIDIVADLSEADIEPFVSSLGDEFYAEPESLRRAVRDRSNSNLIHLPTTTKIDLFIAGGTPLDEQQLQRRLRVAIGPDQFLFMHTAEDILLQKLRWYRLGGEVSDRQWRDVLGIVRVQAERLDLDYLRQSADVLDVSDLLAQALGPPRA